MESQAVKIGRMEVKIDNISEKVDKLIVSVDKHVEAEIKKFDRLDKKYAPKWVQTAIFMLTGTIIGGFIAKIFDLI